MELLPVLISLIINDLALIYFKETYTAYMCNNSRSLKIAKDF